MKPYQLMDNNQQDGFKTALYYLHTNITRRPIDVGTICIITSNVK